MQISKSAKWSIVLLLLLGAGICFKLEMKAATGTFLAVVLVFEFCFLGGILRVNDREE
ncbi:hypothetical protein [Cellvibrio sp. KY-GH-1]|uniref:hypothetical protein n=1 Tax=Cellvibrio sp. KY-GH-1 TaxID=2303332 RepID=UPI001782D567|nr:hypothetical protein [Cellvibrio sp. KY-GH-1]